MPFLNGYRGQYSNFADSMFGPADSALGKLIPEIRIMILEAIIEQVGPVYFHFNHVKTPAIMETCSQIREECISYAIKDVRVIAALSPRSCNPDEPDEDQLFRLQISPTLQEWIDIPNTQIKITRLDVVACRIDPQTLEPTHILGSQPDEVFLAPIPVEKIRHTNACELLDLSSCSHLLEFHLKKEKVGYTGLIYQQPGPMQMKLGLGNVVTKNEDRIDVFRGSTFATYYTPWIAPGSTVKAINSPEDDHEAAWEVISSVTDRPFHRNKFLSRGLRLEALTRLRVPAIFLMLTRGCTTQCATGRLKGETKGVFELADDAVGCFAGPTYDFYDMKLMREMVTVDLEERGECPCYRKTGVEIDKLVNEAAAAYWEPFPAPKSQDEDDFTYRN
ncbi:Hypothetical protein D9617_33g038020 [Elsinoe fawcettii]|nr:Hypothetical protein D9617_33g038020 [Elsinoe fawcettii]